MLKIRFIPLILLDLLCPAQAQEEFIPSPVAQQYITWFSKAAAAEGVNPAEPLAKCYIQASAILGTSCPPALDADAVYRACEGTEVEVMRKAAAQSRVKGGFSDDRYAMVLATKELHKQWKPFLVAWLAVIKVERCDKEGER
jgi:hypothetical protein